MRTETALGEGGASIASVAVDLARGALGDLATRRVLIIGAGATAELTAQALHTQGVSTLFVANRRRERAISLARRFGGASVAFDELPAELERADIVVVVDRLAAHDPRRRGARAGHGRTARVARCC